MNDLFHDPNVAWAALLVVALPLLIIGASELEERMRQRDSAFQYTVSITRIWIVPLLTLWALLRAVFDVERDNIVVRLLASALVLAAAAALLSALTLVTAGLIDRPPRDGRRQLPRLLLAMPRLLVIIATIWFLVAAVWGVNLSSALTALGVTSLVISFALQDTLGGVASGFTLLADQPFGAGDWIEAEDVEGRVVDVNWRSTRLQNRDGDLVVVPNGQLAKATITNFDQPSRVHRVMVPVQIERSAPPTTAKEMLLDAARSTRGVLAEPAPYVFVTNIADPVVDYQAYMFVDDYSIAPRVQADFSSLVWYLSYRHDVPLPNPAQDLYLFDGARTAIESQTSAAEIRRRIVEAALLEHLDDDVLDAVANAATADRFQQGELIAEAGGQHHLYVLNEGRASLVLRRGDDDLRVLDIEPGDVFGMTDATAVVDDRRALIIAASDCDVVRIPPDATAQAMIRTPQLAAAIEQLTLNRRRRTERVLRRANRDALDGRSITSGSTEPAPPATEAEMPGDRGDGR